MAPTSPPGAGEITDEQLTELRSQAEAGQSAAASLEQAQTDLAASGETNTATLTALTNATRQANPTIPPDLISGDTPAAVAASVSQAQATVKQVLEANPPPDQKTPGVTGGAPPRGPAEPPENTRGIARIAWAITNQDKS